MHLNLHCKECKKLLDIWRAPLEGVWDGVFDFYFPKCNCGNPFPPATVDKVEVPRHPMQGDGQMYKAPFNIGDRVYRLNGFEIETHVIYRINLKIYEEDNIEWEVHAKATYEDSWGFRKHVPLYSHEQWTADKEKVLKQLEDKLKEAQKSNKDWRENFIKNNGEN